MKLKKVPTTHVLIIRTTQQSDDILRIVMKLDKYGFRVTMLFTNKYQKNTEEIPGENLYHIQLKIVENFAEVKDALMSVFSQGELKPTIALIDNELVRKELKKYKESCKIYTYSSAFPAIRRERCECFRQTKSQTNFTKVNVNYAEYPHKIAKVPDFIPQVPRFFIFFTAFGYYRTSYNFRIILKSFYTFLARQEKFFGNEVMLAIGGNFNSANYVDDDYFTHFQNTVYSGKFSDHVILLKTISIEQKKAILRLSYAMMYFNVSEDFNEDVKLALSVGTPLIGVDNGFVRNVINREPLSGYLAPLYIADIVGCMYALTCPTHYTRTSSYARLNYLKFHTKYFYELDAFKVQGMKKNLLLPPKKLLNKRKSSLRMLD